MTAEDLISLIRAITMCASAIVLVIALCLTLFFKNYADPTILVTIVGATNLVLGYLAGKRSASTTNGETTKPEKENPKT